MSSNGTDQNHFVGAFQSLPAQQLIYDLQGWSLVLGTYQYLEGIVRGAYSGSRKIGSNARLETPSSCSSQIKAMIALSCL